MANRPAPPPPPPTSPAPPPPPTPLPPIEEEEEEDEEETERKKRESWRQRRREAEERKREQRQDRDTQQSQGPSRAHRNMCKTCHIRFKTTDDDETCACEMIRLKLIAATYEEQGSMFLHREGEDIAKVSYIRGLSGHPRQDRRDIKELMEAAKDVNIPLSPATSSDEEDGVPTYQVIDEAHARGQHRDQEEANPTQQPPDDDGYGHPAQYGDSPRKTRQGTRLGRPPRKKRKVNKK